jgi:thiamine biosynthesis lipoprotein
MQQYNDPVDINRPITVRFANGFYIGEIAAMASPCEILLDTQDEALAKMLTETAAHENWRIEQKYSRYREDGIIPQINCSAGNPVTVDEETAMLIDFAFHCYQLSDGFFDITSGVLRKIWKFDGSDNIPSQNAIDAIMPLIGLQKIEWKNPQITLRPGMEIDLGGIGKEYAVDRVMQCLQEKSGISLLVNFGGDIVANKARANQQPWQVGIEVKDTTSKANQVLSISQGGVATSGDSRRFLLKNGKRYGHILNPKSGWSVANAPRSVTVIAKTCTEAGIISTMAMLQGKNAEKFLKKQGVQFWIQR